MAEEESGISGWQHHTASVNGVRLHYVEMGSGPLVVLLHGFPEFWYCWRHQIPALAAAGYRVIAPDMRGYNRSEKPEGVESYQVERLAEDVAALIRHTGEERAVVVGHDWGGVVAWQTAIQLPAVVDRLIVLNAPHPAAMARELRNPAQLLRSAYVVFFQAPLLPEALIRANHYALLERMFRNQPMRPGAYTDTDIRRYKAALDQPGALTAALNYYRALSRRDPRATFAPPPLISAPTLLIWGDQDFALGIGLTEGLEQWVPGIRVEHLSDASHWVQNDQPERVNALMVEFLGTP